MEQLCCSALCPCFSEGGHSGVSPGGHSKDSALCISVLFLGFTEGAMK